MIILNKFKKYKIHILLFLFVFIAYILITGGNFWEYDSFSVYKTSKSIIDHGNFQIDCFWGEKGLGNRCYSKYGVFMSVAIIPFYLLEKIFLEFFKSKFFYVGFFPSLTNCFATALLSVLFFEYLSKMNFSKRISVVGTLLFSFATFLPAYTKTLFAEPLYTLLIYSCLYILFFSNQSKKILIFAGFLFGLAFITKITALIIFPCLLFTLYFKQTSKIKFLIFLVPIITIFAIFCIYNLFRFGNVFNTGYYGIGFGESIIRGLYLFFVSPGKSLFLYQPIIILFVFGIRKFYHEQKIVFIILGMLLVIHVIFYSIYSFQTGEWAWGPRFLYTILPFFMICTIYFLRDLKNRAFKILFIFITTLSLLIQFSSVYLSYHRYYAFMNKKYGANFFKIVYPNFQYSPIIGQWKMIFHLGYNRNNDMYWKEAFQEYSHFKANYRIAPPDLFFMRSRKLMIIFGIIFGTTELLLFKKIYEAS